MTRHRLALLLASAYVAAVITLATAAAITGNAMIYLTAWVLTMPWGLALPGVVFILGILEWAPLVDTLSVALYGAAAVANVVAIRSIVTGHRRRIRLPSGLPRSEL